MFQEDRFEIPGWDILISALFPGLVGKVGFLREAAEEVPRRVVVRPNVGGGGGGGGGGEKKSGLFGGFFENLGL